VVFWVLLWIAPSGASQLRPALAKLAQKDTVCKVWVIFTDKNDSPRTPQLSPRALARRKRAGIDGATAADIAVSPRYLAGCERLGCRVSQVFKWANAASVAVPAARLHDLAAIAYVNDIVGVRTFSGIARPRQGSGLAKKNYFDSSSLYGVSFGQLSLLNIPAVHRYVSKTLSASPGAGVIIGLFDTGFRTKHACLSEFTSGGHLVADSDFIDHDGTVNDPDSVVNDMNSPYYHNDEHGSMTLSLIAGYDPPNFAGAAWGARFILARTEDTKLTPDGEIEKHYEEDNWAAATVWAESLGVDIVSSSLGYRDGFTFPDTDYTYRDMNGRTTIISKAASLACSLGVIIVNAMGNEGAIPGSLVAPADVDKVISVGAVNSNLTIAGFSSCGPTSDGRIKPDCVAQGVDNAVPDIYGISNDSYTFASGTSFATPLVAGVCALVNQAHSNDPPSLIRSRLLSSCALVPGQSVVNDSFGRGVPNAKIACLPNDVPVSQITIFPNVLNFGKKFQQLKFEFEGSADSLAFSAAIRSVDGALVWTAQVVAKSNVLVLPWPQPGRTVAPGVYFFIANYAGKTYRQKFMVTG